MLVVVVVVGGGVKATPRGRDEPEKETEIERKTEKPKRSRLRLWYAINEGDKMYVVLVSISVDQHCRTSFLFLSEC